MAAKGGAIKSEVKVKASRGAPTRYKPEYAEIARKLCENGATNMDLAREFNVATTTINDWRLKHVEFGSALRIGKGIPDAQVERSLYERATGYTFEEEQLFHYQGDIIRVKTLKHVPPDVTACWSWLNNRRPDLWRSKPESNQTSPEEFGAAVAAALKAADVATTQPKPSSDENSGSQSA